MKIRNGFVSNSSSSSFVVAFPRRPESAEEVRRLLFGDRVRPVEIYGHKAELVDVAQRVWDDIQTQMNQLPMSRVELWDLMQQAAYDYNEIEQLQRSGVLQDPYQQGIAREEARRRMDAENKLIERKAAVLVDDFLAQNGNAFLCRFEYGDDNRFESVLEHGDVFFNLPHRRVSNH